MGGGLGAPGTVFDILLREPRGLARGFREIDGYARTGGEVGAATGDVGGDKEKEIGGTHVGGLVGGSGLKSRQLADTG